MSAALDALVSAAQSAGATVVRTAAAVVIVVPTTTAVDPDELVPLADGAHLGGTSPRALKDAARRGEIEIFGRERSRVVRRSDVLRWVQERRAPVAAVTDPQQSRVEARLA